MILDGFWTKVGKYITNELAAACCFSITFMISINLQNHLFIWFLLDLHVKKKYLF